MSFFDRAVPGPDNVDGGANGSGDASQHATSTIGSPVVTPGPSSTGAHIRNAALPSMSDIEALAASLDQIDQTLADLDQPRPTPLVP